MSSLPLHIHNPNHTPNAPTTHAVVSRHPRTIPSDAAIMDRAPPPTPAAAASSGHSRAWVVQSITALLWVIFRWLECLLWILGKIWPGSAPAPPAARAKPSKQVKTVVIIGGNFAGLAALWELLAWQRKQQQQQQQQQQQRAAGIRIVLIDRNDYCEYTPGILRLFCEPGRFFDLAQNLPSTDDALGFRRIQGTVTSIVREQEGNTNRNIDWWKDPDNKILTYVPASASASSEDDNNNNNNNNPHTLHYDYLILATGATYGAPISPSPGTATTLLDRYGDWKRAHARLAGAKTVIVLGGGAVGVELAAELVDHDPRRGVTIVDAQPSLVPLFPKSVGSYAEEWLSARGVALRLGESLRSWTDRTCTLADGTVLHADIVYVCFGSRPNSEPVVASPSSSPSNGFARTTKRRTIEVRDTLQLVLEGHDNNGDDGDGDGGDSTITELTTTPTPWFACGDVASPPTNDEKQAFQAELQGKLAARNVLRLLAASELDSKSSSNAPPPPPPPRLLSYPRDIAHTDRVPLVFVLSLGKHDGVLGFNQLCIPGPMAAVVKWILEHTKVSHMKGCRLGCFVWKIGDAVTLWLSRTLIRPAGSNTSSAAFSSSSSSSSKPSLLLPAMLRRDVEPQRKRS